MRTLTAVAEPLRDGHRPTDHLLTGGSGRTAALTAGYQPAQLACAVFLLAAAVIALRAPHPGHTARQPAG